MVWIGALVAIAFALGAGYLAVKSYPDQERAALRLVIHSYRPKVAGYFPPPVVMDALLNAFRSLPHSPDFSGSTERFFVYECGVPKLFILMYGGGFLYKASHHYRVALPQAGWEDLGIEEGQYKYSKSDLVLAIKPGVVTQLWLWQKHLKS